MKAIGSWAPASRSTRTRAAGSTRLELGLQGIPFDPKRELRLTYKGHELHTKFIPDLICYGKIVVELKAVETLADEHVAQVLNYLHATGMELGLLVNFGHYPKLQSRRIALTEGRAKPTM